MAQSVSVSSARSHHLPRKTRLWLTKQEMIIAAIAEGRARCTQMKDKRTTRLQVVRTCPLPREMGSIPVLRVYRILFSAASTPIAMFLKLDVSLFQSSSLQNFLPVPRFYGMFDLLDLNFQPFYDMLDSTESNPRGVLDFHFVSPVLVSTRR